MPELHRRRRRVHPRRRHLDGGPDGRRRRRDRLPARPELTPNQVKALLRDSDRPLTDAIDELSLVDAARRFAGDGGRLANQGLDARTRYIDPATGDIDYTRSSWSRSRWSEAGELLRSSWSRSSWSWRLLAGTDSAAVDPTRSSWSRSSWSTSWTK